MQQQRATFAVGDFKRIPNVFGGSDTVAPEDVASAIDELVRAMPAAGGTTLDDIVDFHHRFESIHPFQADNGRVGRILLFQQGLQNGIMPLIVLDAQKVFYYRGLSEYGPSLASSARACGACKTPTTPASRSSCRGFIVAVS